MIETDYPETASIPLILSAIFMLVVVGGVVDLILDKPTTILSWHVAFEALMVVVSLGAATYLARGWYRSQARLAEAALESEQLRREREAWEVEASSLLAGLGSAVSRQFDSWSLTPTEQRVALRLLQGASHKRIARDTQTSERTVRQHAVSVYRKSGLAGRAELAGFFLSPMLLPDDVGHGRSA